MKKDLQTKWVEIRIGDILDYEQPTKYIVESTEYHDSYKTPVLTPGKTFIKGFSNETDGIFENLPVIIFDDFTTASRYVDFKFKVKSSAMKILIPRQEWVNVKYIANWMQAHRIRSETHKRYWISTYSKQLIPLPPLPEQRAIVAKLEQLFSELEDGVANLQKAQQQLKVYRQAVLKKAFEGELTREWRAQQTDLPTAEELLAQIQAERERYYEQQLAEWKQAVADWEAEGKVGKKPRKPGKLKPIGIESPIQKDNQWTEIDLEKVADAIDPQPSHRTPPKKEGGIPYISIANFDKETGKIDFAGARKVDRKVLEEHIARYKLKKGDFVIGKIGTIGKPFFVPEERFFSLSANLVLVCSLKTILPKYLFYLCSSPYIEQQFKQGAKATTQSAFGIKKVRTLRIPFCSLPEQHQIVQEIESRLSVCDQLEQDIEANLKRAERLRQSLLQKAFAGELLTEAELQACRAEPDWEPAEKLLERIKGETKSKA
ncbi:restriction endonuclease subunit S [Phaeodactylibacter luteus]|uniref:Type I restriction modification DNA specificity domain-containing protein n=1 Tax=Phaeodactylibacter luteus TaxID=1564516 RepID=A0A5C6RGJ1_9BACT|nr:restriction endonuclease subunit S [Phaeodactylibacter luteus]TXB60617.1 hypothetical protein FRY97_20175 [Phaeodactylibacter luteus]